MIIACSYLRPDWQIESLHFEDESIAKWFNDKKWNIEFGYYTKLLRTTQKAPTYPTLYIKLKGNNNLKITVIQNSFLVELSKSLFGKIDFKSSKAVTSSKSEVYKLIKLAENGSLREIAQILNEANKNSPLSLRNIFLPIAAFLFFFLVGYFQNLKSQNHIPVTSVEELEVLITDVEYYERKRLYKFYLFTSDYQALFYLPPDLAPSGFNEKGVDRTIEQHGATSARIHIKKIHNQILSDNSSSIPIYSLSIGKNKLFEPEDTIRKDIAIRDNMGSFSLCYYSIIGLFLMIIVKYNLKGRILPNY